MKKIITGAAGLMVLTFCLGAQNFATASAYEKVFVASADSSATVVVGQSDMAGNQENQGAAISGATMKQPSGVVIVGGKLIVADTLNSRVLIYNIVPTSNNATADVVIGQADLSHNEANQGGDAAANTLNYPVGLATDGTKLIIADYGNHRVLIFNAIPTTSNANANLVVGQSDMSHHSANQGGAASASTLDNPYNVYYTGTKLFISDNGNNRVLIFNSLPTTDNASANVVVGQVNMTGDDANQGGGVSENTLYEPVGVWADNDKLIIGDYKNNRVLIYNSIPTSNNASANVVVGQANMSGSTANQGGAASASTLNKPYGVFVYNSKLYIGDNENNRVLVYNSIPTSNNTAADAVVGQADMSGAAVNRGGAVGASTLNMPNGVFADASRLVVGDRHNSRVLIYDNQDVTASPASIKYSKSKGKKKTVTLNFYGLSVSKTKKKYYTVKIGGKSMKVKSVKKYSDRVKVRVQYKYGKKARDTYDVYLKYKYKSTSTTRTAADLITIY
jgi:hypothetical protein